MVDSVKEKASELYSSAKKKVGSLYTKAKENISTYLSKASEKVTTFISTAKQKISEFIDKKFPDWAKNAISSVNKVWKTFSNAVSSWWGSGSSHNHSHGGIFSDYLAGGWLKDDHHHHKKKKENCIWKPVGEDCNHNSVYSPDYGKPESECYSRMLYPNLKSVEEEGDEFTEIHMRKLKENGDPRDHGRDTYQKSDHKLYEESGLMSEAERLEKLRDHGVVITEAKKKDLERKDERNDILPDTH